MDARCPMCGTSYTLEWLGIPLIPGTKATVVCVCAHQLSVSIHPAPRRVLGIPLGRKEVRVDVDIPR